jgi:hypothetical protein
MTRAMLPARRPRRQATVLAAGLLTAEQHTAPRQLAKPSPGGHSMATPPPIARYLFWISAGLIIFGVEGLAWHNRYLGGLGLVYAVAFLARAVWYLRRRAVPLLDNRGAPYSVEAGMSETSAPSELTLLHNDGSPCGSAVENHNGALRCTGHGRAILSGLGREYHSLLEQHMTYLGAPVVIKCRRPGCPGLVRGNNEPEATSAAITAGWSLSMPSGRCPRHRRPGHLHLVPAASAQGGTGQ